MPSGLQTTHAQCLIKLAWYFLSPTLGVLNQATERVSSKVLNPNSQRSQQQFVDQDKRPAYFIVRALDLHGLACWAEEAYIEVSNCPSHRQTPRPYPEGPTRPAFHLRGRELKALSFDAFLLSLAVIQAVVATHLEGVHMNF